MSREERTTISDPKVMRALAHPIRILLLEVLGVEGPLTATRCGELVGQSASLCSFHLRQLAKYGLVEEAEGGAGRERPWQLTSLHQRIDEVPEDEEGSAATAALMRAFFEREFSRMMSYADATTEEPKEWRDVAFFMGTLTWVTPEELDRFAKEMEALISERFGGRRDDPSLRPEGSRPVRVFASGYPITRWDR